MPDIRSIDKEFLQKITEIIEENISNEQFGVSELANEIGMSRSNLLRKVKRLNHLSVSQFIRNVRLEHAREMMEEGIYSVSEVSYKVGFGSTSYFIKCFREHYGFPPGEVGKIEQTKENKIIDNSVEARKKRTMPIAAAYIIAVVFAIVLFVTLKPLFFIQKKTEKSIAVLPFKNDSNDSTNVYLINGLMESTLNNLQKIKDLRVISRTSVEKYRNNLKTTPEIARELDVSYIIEGSGQKIGDQIMLNIQLIDANTDKHLWAEQYSRKTEDIFALQSEVAKNIADKIEVIITPEVEDRIDKVPTDNLVAYDYFLKGLDILNNPLRKNLENSIPYFLKAIQNDNEFARAYAATAMAYYFLDNNKVEKLYSDSINYYADKALFYDSELPQSLIAKALFYMTNKEYTLAVPYFEKALEINPNYDLVFVFLLDLYVNYIPDTEKYLEYALRGLKIDISAYDSTITSFNYLHISNAFIQSGFIDEAIKYINKSLEYDPGNLYSAYTKAYILYAKNRDLNQTKELLLAALAKDSTRLDIMQEVAKIYYYLRDYENSYKYYRKFVDIREMYKLDIYGSENAKISWVFSKMGQNDEAEKYLEKYKTYAENDASVYKHVSLAIYYSSKGMREKAIEELKLFSKQNHYFYWTVIFTPIEPLMDNIKELSEFKEIMKDIENKFQINHERIKDSLEKKGLI